MRLGTTIGEQMGQMSKDERMAQAKRELDDLLAEWQKQYEDLENDGPDALDITTEAVTTISVSLGGPTAYLEFNHATGAARYFTNAPDYAARTDYGSEMIELYAEDAQEVEEMFQLQALAIDSGFPVGQ